ncbi:MerR family transcriptional regulator [Pontibacillus yanchengensis]|uniref:MerR family transcriptional regulator n=1 Tax=Pontibacillus yanchengensis TaxID=462910 RepID=A0ACC7VJJ5_9BACI|nr:MerR family transcriptional regulator [Pontibacillus yanchengensis]MYL54963.1 MerR family transcriptional regulator [Pontibacillus yanchengensis]
MSVFSTGEVSKRLEISVRTLRYYDQIGLVHPSVRAENGTRYYSEEAILTIEKITILKQLSLSLEDIHKLLDQVSMKEILRINKQFLETKKEEIDNSISKSNTLLHVLDLEGKISWEHLIPLIKQYPIPNDTYEDLFTEKEEEALQRTLPKMEEDDDQIKRWINIIKRIEKCLEKNIDVSSDEGQIIASDTILLSKETFGGDESLAEKFFDARKSNKQPNSLNLYPVKEEIMEFMDEAIKKYEEDN